MVSSRGKRIIELEPDADWFEVQGVPLNSDNVNYNSVSDISGVWAKLNPPPSKNSLNSGTMNTANNTIRSSLLSPPSKRGVSQLSARVLSTSGDGKIIHDSRISTASSFHRGARCFQFIYAAFLLSWLALSIFISHFVISRNGSQSPNWLVYSTIYSALSIIGLQILGRHLISSVYYPYQNQVQKEHMDRNSNLRFGIEFAHYLDAFLYSL